MPRAVTPHTYGFVFEDFRVPPVGVLAPELPHVEERLPVDAAEQPVQVVGFEHVGAD